MLHLAVLGFLQCTPLPTDADVVDDYVDPGTPSGYGEITSVDRNPHKPRDPGRRPAPEPPHALTAPDGSRSNNRLVACSHDA